MRVLVVEDHELLARTVGVGPRREGMAVDVVLDGDDVLEHLAVTRYDVVVLDRDLPGAHGNDICRRPAEERSLLSHAGIVVSTEELLERVWDEAANPFTNTVKTTIGRLRAKLGEPPPIETVREGGYPISVS